MGDFKKIIIAFVLFFAFFSLKAQSEIVEKVTVEGNQRIALETIIIFGDKNILNRLTRWFGGNL